MAETFRDGIEAAAQLIEARISENSPVMNQMWADLARDIRALSPSSTALMGVRLSVLVALEARFRYFAIAFLAAGGNRQPKSIDAKGWDAARKNFIRLVTKQKHNPDAIVSGTWAYADHMKAKIDRDPANVDFVPAPEVFLNKEWFTKTWTPNGGGPKPTGNQRGATSLFDVGFGQSR